MLLITYKVAIEDFIKISNVCKVIPETRCQHDQNIDNKFDVETANTLSHPLWYKIFTSSYI